MCVCVCVCRSIVRDYGNTLKLFILDTNSSKQFSAHNTNVGGMSDQEETSAADAAERFAIGISFGNSNSSIAHTSSVSGGLLLPMPLVANVCS